MQALHQHRRRRYGDGDICGSRAQRRHLVQQQRRHMSRWRRRKTPRPSARWRRPRQPRSSASRLVHSSTTVSTVAVGVHNAALTASHKQPRATVLTASTMTASRAVTLAAARNGLSSRYGSLVSVASLVAFLKAAAEERYFECRNKRWCR